MRLGLFYKGAISSQLQKGAIATERQSPSILLGICHLSSLKCGFKSPFVEQIWSKVGFSLPRLLFCLLCVWKEALFSYNSILWTPESGVHISNDDLTMCEEVVGPPSSPETRCSWFFRRHFCRPCGSSRRSPCMSPETYALNIGWAWLATVPLYALAIGTY